MKTYWNNYKQENPTRASEIESLGLDFSNLPEKEVKEKIFSLETMANSNHCSISELKSTVRKSWEGKFEDSSDLFYLMEGYDKESFGEAENLNIERTNTAWMIFEGWVLEKVQEIESKYSHLPHRSKQNPMTLLMQFRLEDENEFSILRKTHIYLKNCPMANRNKKYVKLIEEIFDKYIDSYVKPLVEHEEGKANASLFNANIGALIFMAGEKIIEECNNLVEECNNHDVSFYAELDIAKERAKDKYFI